MPGIGQQDAAKVCCRARADDGTAESGFHQQRQIAGVINVSMGQDNRGYTGRSDGRLGPVAQSQRLEALEQSAIDQDAVSARSFQEIFRSRDGARAPEER